MDTITVKGKTVELNGNGWLANPEEWSPDVAAYIAAIEGIEMTEQHWAVVHCLRDYYHQHRAAPLVNTLLNEVGRKLELEKVSTRYLYQLYPCGPAHQACKIAGLPSSTGCL